MGDGYLAEHLDQDRSGRFFLSTPEPDGRLTNRRHVTAEFALELTVNRINGNAAGFVSYVLDSTRTAVVGSPDATPESNALFARAALDRLLVEKKGNFAAWREAVQRIVRKSRATALIYQQLAASAGTTPLGLLTGLEEALAKRRARDGEANPKQVGGEDTLGTGPIPAAARQQGLVPDTARAGDPVLPSSGQLLLEEVDLEVTGIGLDFRLERTYLSGLDYEGFLGPKWDHSYNLWLREAVEGHADGGWEYAVYRGSGKLKPERFVMAGDLPAPPDLASITDVVFVPPDGVHERLAKIGGRFVLETTDAKRIEYDETGWATKISDLAGNAIDLRYLEEPRRLSEIRDTCGRIFRFEYDEAARLIEVRDHALGRTVEYGYDAQGRLVAVRHSTGLPAEPYRMAAYRYWGAAAPDGMADKIVAITDPRGIEVLQTRYGANPHELAYGRVVEQRNGGVTQYDYEHTFEETETPDGPVLGVLVRVLMRGPDGERLELDYNRHGRLARRAVWDGATSGGRWLETRLRYNVDGNVLREEHPSGRVVDYEYGRERFVRSGRAATEASAEERLRFGELRRLIERAAPGHQGPPTRVTELDYDHRFSLVVEQRGPYYATATGARIDPGGWTMRSEYDAAGMLIASQGPDCTLPDGTLQTGRRLELRRDPRGRVRRREETGRVIEYGYPPDGHPAANQAKEEILDPDGLRLRRLREHDAGGRLLRDELPTGLITTRGFDHLGREQWQETSSHVPGGQPSRVQTRWAAHDRPVEIVRTRVGSDGLEQPDARVTESSEFDAQGAPWIVRVRSNDGQIEREIRTERRADGQPRRTVVAGVETTNTHDGRGLLVEQRVSAAGTSPLRTTWSYDAEGRLDATTDPAGLTERLTRDGFGRVIRRDLPGGAWDELTWDAADRPLSSSRHGKHPDHAVPVRLSEQHIDRDEAGRPWRVRTAVFDPAESVPGTSWSEQVVFFDPIDRPTREVSPSGHVTAWRYDGASRPVECTDARDRQGWSYGDSSRVVVRESVSSGPGPDGQVHTLRVVETQHLDSHGNVVALDDGIGNRTNMHWDSSGNQVATVGPTGIRHEVTYAADGLARAVDRAHGTSAAVRWEYRYDRERRLEEVLAPRGRALRVERDGLGRLLAQEWGPPGAPRDSIEYDLGGRVNRRTDGRGVSTEINYGPDGLPERLRFSQPPGAGVPGPTEIAFTRDGAGQLVGIDDGARPVVRRYDSRGLLVAERTTSQTTRWSYDDAGRPAEVRSPTGTRTGYRWDPRGRLTGVTDLATGTTVLERWPLGAGQLAERWRGRSTREVARDGAGRVVRVTELVGASVALDWRQLHDGRGLPVARQIAQDGERWSELIEADGQSRVAQVLRAPALPPLDTARAEQGGAQAEHDAAVRSLRAQAGAAPVVDDLRIGYWPDGPRQRVSRAVGTGAPTVTTFDRGADGSLSTVGGEPRSYDGSGRLSSAGPVSYQHDVTGQLVAVGGPAGRTEIDRDALGRPVRLSSPAGTWALSYDGKQISAVDGPTGRVDLVRDPSSGATIETLEAGSSLRPLSDGAGSPLGFISQDGSSSAARRFDPFGRVDAQRGTWASPLGFEGLLDLPGTGLALSAFRTYEPATGTYLEPDPAGLADGLDRYTYAHSNPYAFDDPLGLSAQPKIATGRTLTAEEMTRLVDFGGFPPPRHRGTPPILKALVFPFRMAYGAGRAVFHRGVEAGRQTWDLTRIGVSVVGRATGLTDYTPGAMTSSVGRAAEAGASTTSLLRAQGSSIIHTPGRLLDAISSGDPEDIGEELSNTVELGIMAGYLGASAWSASRRGIGALHPGRGGGRTTLSSGSVELFHGTTESGARSILSEGLLPVSRNTAPFPEGSFFTFEGPLGGRAASHWASRSSRLYGGKPVALRGTMPQQLFDDLSRQGMIRTSAVAGVSGFPPQTVILPEGLPAASPAIKWSPIPLDY